jgi:hypothetical protein
MESQILGLLKAHSNDDDLGRAASAALELLHTAKLIHESGPRGQGQSSRYLADMHAFRKRSGYYKEGAVIGLEETIFLMGRKDIRVHLRALERPKA